MTLEQRFETQYVQECAKSPKCVVSNSLTSWFFAPSFTAASLQFCKTVSS